MPRTVNKLSITYNAINQNNTFSTGDLISGQVILEVAKNMQIDSLSVKFKGKAYVKWSQPHHNFLGKEKYYSVKRYFILDNSTHANDPEMINAPSGLPYSSAVTPGLHVYPFTFRLPFWNFPPTYKGIHGEVLYTLETKLYRFLHISLKDKTKFNYVPRPILTDPGLTVPQHGTKTKKMKLFTTGSVSMSISIEKMGYYLGEDLKVLAEIENNSSRAIKPKFSLLAKHSYFVHENKTSYRELILREKDELIEPNSKKTVTKVLSIPPSITISILTSKILKLEYNLNVYLAIPYAFNPTITFPIVILPLHPESGVNSATNRDFRI